MSDTSVNAIFEELAATKSRNAKEAILLREKENDNVLFRECLRLALDPFTRFYIRKIPPYVNNGKERVDLRYAIEEALPLLATRQVTGNTAISLVRGLLVDLPPEDAEVLKRIIKKDPDCGVQISTANKIWPKLVHEYPMMLATAYTEKLVAKMRKPYIVQLKSDGKRFNAIVRNADDLSKVTVEYFARGGNSMDLLQTNNAGTLNYDFIAFARGLGLNDVVFDGEGLVLGEDGKILPRQIGNGILSKATKGTLSQEEADRVKGAIWDYIPYDEWIKGVWRVPYETRLANLQKMVWTQMAARVDISESKTANTWAEVLVIYQEYLERGEEGAIVKDGHMPWEDGRSKLQIKLKDENECDLVITGWQEHRERPGQLGAVIAESRDGQIRVNVGSGFDDGQRRTLTEEAVIGKIIAVKYNQKIQAGNGEWSLFLPRAVEIRDDKTTADSFDEVK